MANVKKIKQKTTGTLLDIEDTQARSDIASEVTNRTNADKALDDKVKAETEARTSADNALNQKIVQETTDRTNADNALQEKINTNKNDISVLKGDIANSKEAIEELNDKKITKFYTNSLGQTTLNDSDNGKIQDMMLYGKSEQKSYTGKNLVQKVIYGYINSGGNAILIDNSSTSVIAYLEDGKTYKISCNVSLDRLKIGQVETTNIVHLTPVTNVYEGNTNTYVFVAKFTGYAFVYVKASKNTSVIKSIQIEEGDTATEYEPYVGGIPSPNPDYPQEIKNVVNPVVNVCGKNLLNTTLQTTTVNGVTITNNGDGTYTLNGESTGIAYFDFYSNHNGLPALKGKSYKMLISNQNIEKVNLQIYVDTGNGWSIYSTTSGLGTIINFDETFKGILIRYIINASGVTLNNLVLKPMLTTDLSATYDEFEPYKPIQTATLPYTLNAIPVSEGGNVMIDGQQYIADYVDIEGKKIHRLVDSSKLDPTVSIVDNPDWLLSAEEVIDLTDEEVQAFKELATYYPTTNVFVTSDQLDGYTTFNYPLSMANGWNLIKEQLGDTREYIYDMELQSAEAYVNSEYAVTLTELGV